MNIQQAVRSCLGKYATFAGRASRSEYWFFVLAYLIAVLVAGVLDSMLEFHSYGSPTGFGPFYAILSLVLFLPSVSVAVRRLHDLDRSGWWWWLWVTIVGFFVLLYWFCRKGTAGENRFGPDPLAS